MTTRELAATTLIDISAHVKNSETISLQEYLRGSFQMPAAFTGVAITFNVSNDGVNWQACPIEGNETNPLTVAVDKSYEIPDKAFKFKFLQLVSGSNELADRTIAILLRRDNQF